MQGLIRDIAPAVEIARPVPWALLLTVLAVLLLVLLALWLYRRRRKEPPPIKLPPPIPPGEQALKALAALQFGDIKQYYTDLSAIVRLYIERRFSLQAPEQTTEEFLVQASRSQLLGDGYRQMLEGFLREADMVKFAKYQLSPAHAEESAQGLKIFVAESQDDAAFREAQEAHV